LGRLSKKDRDRIRVMIGDGFTIREIVSEVGCSASTVSRMRKESRDNVHQSKELSVESALLKSVYQIHLGIELFNTIPNQEDLFIYFRDCAIELTDNILKVNSVLGKKVIFESTFFDYIMSILKIRPEKLNENDKLYRQRWIKILKQWYPEKLAELM